jgi:hypothetical protein
MERGKTRTHLGELDLLHEAHAEVLEHDAVGGGEEGEDVADEVALVVRQVLPVLLVVAQVNLLGYIKWG